MKVVFTKGEYSVVRTESYGFRCSSLEVSWEVKKGEEFVSSALRLKDAKKIIEMLTK